VREFVTTAAKCRRQAVRHLTSTCVYPSPMHLRRSAPPNRTIQHLNAKRTQTIDSNIVDIAPADRYSSESNEVGWRENRHVLFAELSRNHRIAREEQELAELAVSCFIVFTCKRYSRVSFGLLSRSVIWCG